MVSWAPPKLIIVYNMSPLSPFSGHAPSSKQVPLVVCQIPKRLLPKCSVMSWFQFLYAFWNVFIDQKTAGWILTILGFCRRITQRIIIYGEQHRKYNKISTTTPTDWQVSNQSMDSFLWFWRLPFVCPVSVSTSFTNGPNYIQFECFSFWVYLRFAWKINFSPPLSSFP